jgi:hypothetical protein
MFLDTITVRSINGQLLSYIVLVLLKESEFSKELLLLRDKGFLFHNVTKNSGGGSVETQGADEWSNILEILGSEFGVLIIVLSSCSVIYSED